MIEAQSAVRPLSAKMFSAIILLLTLPPTVGPRRTRAETVKLNPALVLRHLKKRVI
jgi:hypothetical protein